MNAQFSSLREDLSTLTDKHELKSEIAALRAVIADREESINVLKSVVGFMKAKVTNLANLIDDEDAYIHRESLIYLHIKMMKFPQMLHVKLSRKKKT